MNKNKIIIIISTSIFVILSTLLTTYIIKTNKTIYELKYKNKINETLKDDKEIEKKWLIDKNKIPYDLSKVKNIYEIEQTYISFAPEIRVRKINKGQAYSFAVKTNLTENGLIRNELEEYITEEEYNNLYKKKEANTIYKTRYQLLDNDYILSIDIFHNNLEPLAYLEIEFANEEEAKNYKKPNWIIKDVTDDINYKNGYLARYGIPKSYYTYINNK